MYKYEIVQSDWECPIFFEVRHKEKFTEQQINDIINEFFEVEIYFVQEGIDKAMKGFEFKTKEERIEYKQENLDFYSEYHTCLGAERIKLLKKFLIEDKDFIEYKPEFVASFGFNLKDEKYVLMGEK